jgi:selenophosphate synthase
VSWGELPLAEQLVLADAQTSGGLLIATRAPDVLEAALGARGVHSQRIGATAAGPAGRIRVTGHLRQS